MDASYSDKMLNLAIPSDIRGQRFAYACISSGIKSSSAVIKAGVGILVDVLVYTDGANNGTVTIYDNATAASGHVLAKEVVKGEFLQGGEVNILCNCDNGLYMELSGTGATAIIRYA